MPVHPTYIEVDPSDTSACSIPVLRASDNARFLASTISTAQTPNVKDPKEHMSLASVILPYAATSISRILNHPNIISLVDIVHTTSLPGDPSAAGKHRDLLVWEDMNAGSLSSLLPSEEDLPPWSDREKWDTLTAENYRRFSLPEGLCWHVLRSISRVLLWLHCGIKEVPGARGEWRKVDEDWQPILIMDVSPGQIWFQRPKGREHYGPCKLGGFRHARVAASIRVEDATADPMPNLPGKRSFYFAPEVYKNESSPSCASEIYSLGATVYAMMTGIPPSRNCTYVWNFSRMNDKGFSKPIREVVSAMINPDVGERPAAEELVKRVDEGYKVWRETSRSGMAHVDVDDE